MFRRRIWNHYRSLRYLPQLRLRGLCESKCSAGSHSTTDRGAWSSPSCERNITDTEPQWLRPNASWVHELYRFREFRYEREIHTGIKCDGCHACPLEGVRFKCLLCVDVDFCSGCKEAHAHQQFLYLPKALDSGWEQLLPRLLLSSFAIPGIDFTKPPPSGLNDGLFNLLTSGLPPAELDSRYNAALMAQKRILRREQATRGYLDDEYFECIKTRPLIHQGGFGNTGRIDDDLNRLNRVHHPRSGSAISLVSLYDGRPWQLCR